MSDSSSKFLPASGEMDPVKPLAHAVDEAERLARDPELQKQVEAFRAEGTVPPHALEASVKAAAQIVREAPTKARRRAEPGHRVGPVLVVGRPNTDPGLGGPERLFEPDRKPTTHPGLGPLGETLHEPEPIAPAVSSAEKKPEPDAMMVPSPSAAAEGPPAEPKAGVAITPAPAEPVSVPSGAPTAAVPNALVKAAAPKSDSGSSLAGAGRRALGLGFEANQRKEEAKLDVSLRQKLFRDRERVEQQKLDPTSDAYLEMAERWVVLGLDLSKDEKQAEVDRHAVYARRALRDLPSDATDGAAPGRAPKSAASIAVTPPPDAGGTASWRIAWWMMMGLALALGFLGLGVYLGLGAIRGADGASRAASTSTALLTASSPLDPSLASTPTHLATAASPSTGATSAAPTETAAVAPSGAGRPRPPASSTVPATPTSTSSASKPPTPATATAPAPSSSSGFSKWKGND